MGMRADLGWAAICDGSNIIGLYQEKGGGAISLEPGGQFELSGAPLATIHETEAELDAHLESVKSFAAGCGIGFLTLGMNPKHRLAEIPMMPKQRYAIMAKYMPKVGSRGLDMMFRTATVQANLDFSSEADMVKKLRVSLALQPVATALFANSPFTDGKLNGFLSARSEVWRDTDPARTGMLPFAFEPGMGFERYVDYALDVPMYFVKRGVDLYRRRRREFPRLAGWPSRGLAGRACDPFRLGQPSLDDLSRGQAEALSRDARRRRRTAPDADRTAGPVRRAALRFRRARSGARADQAVERGGPGKIARRRAAPCAQGRDRRASACARSPKRCWRWLGAALQIARRLDSRGRDETHFLDPLDAIAAGRSEAERLIRAFQTEWARKRRTRLRTMRLLRPRAGQRALTRRRENSLFPRSFACARQGGAIGRAAPEIDETPSDQSLCHASFRVSKRCARDFPPAEAKNLGSSLDGARWLGFRQSRMQVRR